MSTPSSNRKRILADIAPRDASSASGCTRLTPERPTSKTVNAGCLAGSSRRGARASSSPSEYSANVAPATAFPRPERAPEPTRAQRASGAVRERERDAREPVSAGCGVACAKEARARSAAVSARRGAREAQILTSPHGSRAETRGVCEKRAGSSSSKKSQPMSLSRTDHRAAGHHGGPSDADAQRADDRACAARAPSPRSIRARLALPRPPAFARASGRFRKRRRSRDRAPP